MWALWQLWRSLGFDDLAAAWRRSRVELDVLGCLRAMVFNHLCDPGSKLGVLRWLETVALPLDFGFADGPPPHQHLLRAMDVIDEHSDALGTRLATLMRPLIDEDLSVVFYDLTTVEVAGEAVVPDDVRAYGLRKSGLVARQFMLSLVQTAEGLPIAHEVHPGNIAEAKTLLPMIKSLLARYPLKRVVLVADRRLLSVNNLDKLTKLQVTLAAEGRAVSLEYVLAVPAARYGDNARRPARIGQQPARRQAVGCRDHLAVVTQIVVQGIAFTGAHIGAGPHDHRAPAGHRPRPRRGRAAHPGAQQSDHGSAGAGRAMARQARCAGRRGRPLSDSGAKARFYHAVKDANLAHLIKVDLQADSLQLHDRRGQAALPRTAGRQAAAGEEHRRAGGRGGAALQAPGRHRAGLPRVEVRHRDRPGVSPAAAAHSCPRAGVLHDADPVPGDAHAPEGRRAAARADSVG